MNELDLFAAVPDPDKREAFLKRECAGQPDLRMRIDRLLEQDFKSHSLLDFPERDGAGGRAPPAVEPLNREALRCGRVHFLECIVLIAVELVALTLAWHYPSPRHATPWYEKDWRVWFQAHQLFRRDPEELSESELEDVKQWCRCLTLNARYNETGLNGLTDDECVLVVETLEKRCPHPHERAPYLVIYEECRRRLADAPPSSGDRSPRAEESDRKQD